MTPIIVFAKAPVPGTVKTRLAPRLNGAAGARLHTELVERTLRTAVDGGLGAVELCCAPDTQHPFFTQCATRFGVTLAAQGDGDLGARMARALSRHLAATGPAILIGTDCPALDADYLRAAARALESHDVVIGPAEDGGYVLVAARRVIDAMFADIAWGTASVLATTRARLAQARVRHHELATRWDLDRPADYDRYLRECARP